MTSKKRILTALAHKEPDRIPFDLGATALSSIHYTSYNDLVRYLGKEHLVRDKEDTAFMDLVQSIVQIDIDIALFEDDLGIQNTTMISPQMYRDLIKPRHERLFSFVKQKTSGPIQIMLHSDGSIYDLIPDLIDIGVDILNPIQVSAAKMDTLQLKMEFGSELVFWGAGVDTQGVLAFGTAAEVKDEVKRRIDDLAPGGGLVFAAIHNIQPNVSPRNIMAMWETLQEYGKY